MMMMARITIPCDVEAFFVKPSFSMNKTSYEKLCPAYVSTFPAYVST